MTSLVDDSGNYLVYGGEDFTLSKQAASIINGFKIKGNVSVNFEIDNNSVNRARIGYNGPMQISSPVLGRIPFNLIRNGNYSDRGYIAVTNITSSKIEAFFVSGNSNWMQDFQFLITNIDFSKDSNLEDFWPNITSSTIARTSGIVWPLVDWAYNRQHRNTIYSYFIWSDESQTVNDTYSDFYPCYYLKDLVRNIFKTSNYKLSGDIINDKLYNSTIITPNSPNLQYSDSFVSMKSVRTKLLTSQFIAGIGTFSTLNLTAVAPSPYFTDSTHDHRSPGLFMYDVVVNIVTSVAQGYEVSFQGSSAGTAINRLTTGTAVLSYTIPNAYFGPLGTLNHLVIRGDTVNFTVLAGSSVTYQLRKKLNIGQYLQPNVILPSLKAVDIIKSMAIRFGCVVTFDEASKTISLNQIDKITASEDWSSYLVSFEDRYQEGFKNNYIRVKQSSEFSEYNDSNETNYGEANLDTEFDVNQDQDLYQDPFGPALDGFMTTIPQLLQPYIPLINYEDSDSFDFSTITNTGGYAVLNGTGFTIAERTIIRIVDNNGYYSGYCLAVSVSATTIQTSIPYSQTSNGIVIKQGVSFSDAGSRLLVHTPSYPITNFGESTSVDIDNEIINALSLTNYTSFGYAYHSKPRSGKEVDHLKEGLSYGSLNLQGYTDIPLSNRYRYVKNMVGKSKLPCKMLIPEAVYQNYNFNKKIFILCPEFSGYFWIDRIWNYKDSTTEVDVDLLFMHG